MGKGRARKNETGARARAIALNIGEDMQRTDEGREEERRREKRTRNEASADGRLDLCQVCSP